MNHKVYSHDIRANTTMECIVTICCDFNLVDKVRSERSLLVLKCTVTSPVVEFLKIAYLTIAT